MAGKTGYIIPIALMEDMETNTVSFRRRADDHMGGAEDAQTVWNELVRYLPPATRKGLRRKLDEAE